MSEDTRGDESSLVLPSSETILQVSGKIHHKIAKGLVRFSRNASAIDWMNLDAADLDAAIDRFFERGSRGGQRWQGQDYWALAHDYNKSYTPLPASHNIATIKKLFGNHFEVYNPELYHNLVEPILPGMESIAFIPNVDIPYQEQILKAFPILKKVYMEELGLRLEYLNIHLMDVRPKENKLRKLREIASKQDGANLLALQFEWGRRHPAHPNWVAARAEREGGFALGLLEVVWQLIQNPRRLMDVNDAYIACPGDVSKNGNIPALQVAGVGNNTIRLTYYDSSFLYLTPTAFCLTKEVFDPQ